MITVFFAPGHGQAGRNAVEGQAKAVRPVFFAPDSGSCPLATTCVNTAVLNADAVTFYMLVRGGVLSVPCAARQFAAVRSHAHTHKQRPQTQTQHIHALTHRHTDTHTWRHTWGQLIAAAGLQHRQTAARLVLRSETTGGGQGKAVEKAVAGQAKAVAKAVEKSVEASKDKVTEVKKVRQWKV